MSPFEFVTRVVRQDIMAWQCATCSRYNVSVDDKGLPEVYVIDGVVKGYGEAQFCDCRPPFAPRALSLLCVKAKVWTTGAPKPSSRRCPSASPVNAPPRPLCFLSDRRWQTRQLSLSCVTFAFNLARVLVSMSATQAAEARSVTCVALCRATRGWDRDRD